MYITGQQQDIFSIFQIFIWNYVIKDKFEVETGLGSGSNLVKSLRSHQIRIHNTNIQCVLYVYCLNYNIPLLFISPVCDETLSQNFDQKSTEPIITPNYKTETSLLHNFNTYTATPNIQATTEFR